MPDKTLHGFKRIKNATKYSCQDLKAAFKHEPAFQEEVVLAALMIPAALFIGDSQWERILLIATVVLVLIAELFNVRLKRSLTELEQSTTSLPDGRKILALLL